MSKGRRAVAAVRVCAECGAEDEWWATRPPEGTCSRCARKRGYRKDPAKAVMRQRTRWSGLSEEDWQRVLDGQGNRCWLCRKPFGKSRRPHLDHRHSDGELRGALCPGCNQELGYRHEDAGWFQRASEYLTDPPLPKILGERHFVPDSPGAQ